MHLEPFPAWLPDPDLAADVASVPYDVVDRAEARSLLHGRPLSFLRVTRADADLPDGVPADADAVYEAARRAWDSLRQRGVLRQDERPSFYVYRQTAGAHAQTGLVAACRAADTAAGLIKKHEKTRLDKENDRCRHILTLRAHTGLVFLAYRDEAGVDALIQAAQEQAPFCDFTAEDGVCHTVWRAPAASALQHAFERVPCAYIADGHHRAAAAARAALQLGPEGGPAAASARFPAVLFPASHLRILPYNRCVADLNGLSEAQFLAALRKRFEVAEGVGPVPPGPGRVCLLLGGAWYQLNWPPAPAGSDPVSALDGSVLQQQVLAPLLGIADPRTDTRIRFVGGIRGIEELERQVESGQAAAAFSMAPVTMDQLMAVADAGQCLPPKSTWFEPKLRDGLLVHTF